MTEKDSLLGNAQDVYDDRNYYAVRNGSGSARSHQNLPRFAQTSIDSHHVGDDEADHVLSFHNINYTVNVRKNPCFGGSTKKTILRNINGLFKPGMNAILGPTGSGKSSLLDVLAGRKDPRGLTGNLLLDGHALPENFKCLVGYVVQDDVVMGTLTVRENFEFSARLRLPSSVTPEQRNAKIDQVIYELGLSEVADAKVGTEFIRGVSGGERKRCNIGMELIISPPVLFLDEPTTGLDASTANAVMMLLKRMSERGRNIIFSIHQPRYSIYRLFDNLMLLSHGDVVYSGPSHKALDYFNTLGFECELHNNPPDFFLDVINGDSTAVSAHADAYAQNGTFSHTTMPGEYNDNEDKRLLARQYLASSEFKALNQELQGIYETHMQDLEAGVVNTKKIDYASSFTTQLWVVSGRCVKNIYRNPAITVLQFFVIILFAIIVGGVYFDLDSSLKSGIQNRVGAFFFIIMNQVFGNMSAVELFLKERAIFLHENVGGFYRVPAYFLAKVFCDVIPMRMIPCILFSSVSYFMIGLRQTADKFFFFTLTLFLTALSASALSFAISASVEIFAIGNLCLALSYVFMMLFSGLLINVADLGAWISWIKYLSIFRFGLSALEINELKDQLFCNGTLESIECISGNSYLDDQGVYYNTDWDVWSNLVALTIMVFVFLLLALVQLLRRTKILK